jgi:branched-chain amino acid transport system substrate-binding protein
MRRQLVLVAAVALVAVSVSIPGAFGSNSGGSQPGLTARTVTIGGTFPISGPAALYAPIAKGMQAYFSYINARRAASDKKRGVYGRQIIFKVYDDQYNPAQAVELTRRLVEQDRVFALVGGLGTEPQTPVRPYANQQRVPQLFVSTGATTWGRDRRQFPWTIGWQPDYQSEGRAYGQHIRTNQPNAKVAILFQNDDYGKDYLAGFEPAVGESRIVAKQGYEVTAPSVASQVAQLRASGADTLLIVGTPRGTIQALVTAYRLGWRPALYVNSVAATDSFLSQARAAAGGAAEAVNGIITTTYLKDPASPVYARDATVRLYKRLMAKYAPGLDANNGLYFYGMAKAHTFVQALYRAGRNPTRQSLMNASVNIKLKSPWLIPGSEISSSARSPFPISIVRLTRYSNGSFSEFGPLIKTR